MRVSYVNILIDGFAVLPVSNRILQDEDQIGQISPYMDGQGTLFLLCGQPPCWVHSQQIFEANS